MRDSSKEKAHASSRQKPDWKSIEWKTVERKVRKLQVRIAKAVLVTEQLGRLNAKVAKEGLELCDGKLSCPVLRRRAS